MSERLVKAMETASPQDVYESMVEILTTVNKDIRFYIETGLLGAGEKFIDIWMENCTGLFEEYGIEP